MVYISAEELCLERPSGSAPQTLAREVARLHRQLRPERAVWLRGRSLARLHVAERDSVRLGRLLHAKQAMATQLPLAPSVPAHHDGVVNEHERQADDHPAARKGQAAKDHCTTDDESHGVDQDI